MSVALAMHARRGSFAYQMQLDFNQKHHVQHLQVWGVLNQPLSLSLHWHAANSM